MIVAIKVYKPFPHGTVTGYHVVEIPEHAEAGAWRNLTARCGAKPGFLGWSENTDSRALPCRDCGVPYAETT